MIEKLNSAALPAITAGTTNEAARKTTAGQLSFNQVLEQQLGSSTELKFSAHAQERLQSRNISLSSEDLVRLKQGVAQAAAKGSKESLLLKDDVAFVVSVKNQTVITAVDAASMKGNVFTNIDSAVIV
ncbi:MAG TPA: TIGR02530 family flagellar biosynthesis protein [bacterium]|nr:TIGR02530 family flagellar biosynthesis protein [bacterium]